MVSILALSVKACRLCQIPPFVAARHLPPARGKSFLKGGASGGTAYFAWIAKASHFGRSGIAQAMTERARLPTFCKSKFPKYAIYSCKSIVFAM